MSHHYRLGAAPGRQGRRHRLGLRGQREPGRIRLHGHPDRSRQDHDGGRRRLHGDVVLAGRAGPQPLDDDHAGFRAGSTGDDTSPRGSNGARFPRSPRAGAEVMRPARRTVPLALAALFAFGSSCGHEAEISADETPVANEKPVPGDTFVQASIGDISGLIPNITTDQSSHEVGGLIYDGLVQTDKDLNEVPSLAESWQFSKDCLTLTFKLRKDVKWHDGKPFTAEDVLFTYKTMMNPKTPTAYRDDFELVRDVQVLD